MDLRTGQDRDRVCAARTRASTQRLGASIRFTRARATAIDQPTVGAVERRDRLGELIHEYFCVSA
jgi:hypothetical protein